MKLLGIALALIVVCTITAWSYAELLSPANEGGGLRGAASPAAPKLVSGEYVLESPDPLQPNHPLQIDRLKLEIDGQKITGGRYLATTDGRDNLSTFSGEWAIDQSSIILMHQQSPDGYHAFWVLQSTGDVWSGTWVDNYGHNGTTKLSRKDREKGHPKK